MNGARWGMFETFIVVVVTTIIGTFWMANCMGCASHSGAVDAAAITAYGAELAMCRESAGTNYSKYEICARDVDDKWSRK